MIMNDIDLRGTETGESEFTLPDRKPEELFSELGGESPSELIAKLKNCEERCRDLRDQNEKLYNRNLDLTSIINQKEEEIGTLREELYAAKAKIAQLQQREEFLTQKLQECREIAERLRAQIIQLRDQIRLCEEEKLRLNEEIKRLKEGIEIYRKDNHNLEDEVELLIVKHKFEREEFKREIANLKEKMDKIEAILTEYKKIVDTWETEKAHLETENERLKEKINRLKDLFNDLFQRIQDVKSSSDVQGSELEKLVLEIEEPQRVQESPFEQPENLSESTFQPPEKDEYPWPG
jgi:chromosome segregation ATPase